MKFKIGDIVLVTRIRFDNNFNHQGLHQQQIVAAQEIGVVLGFYYRNRNTFYTVKFRNSIEENCWIDDAIKINTLTNLEKVLYEV